MYALSTTDEINTTVVRKKRQWRGVKKPTRKIQEEAQTNSHVDDMQIGQCTFPDTNATFYRDILAIVTEKQRAVVWAVYDLIGRWQQSKSYKILFQKIHPPHILTFIAVTTTAMLLNPLKNTREVRIKPSPFISLVYLSAFMVHFGAQIWMTFVSGLSLYFAVPRHTFGEVQQVLFPRYFGLNSFLSLITLTIFVKLHPTSTWDAHMALQVGAMAVCFLLELLICLYLTPPHLNLIAAKIAMEKAAGVGLEVGQHDPGPLTQCPHYIIIHKAFRKVHTLIAIGNVMSMACTLLHLLYLANKLSVL